MFEPCNNITRTYHQSYPTDSQDRPLLENIQQSLSLSSRIPVQRSQGDIPTRTVASHFQNKPVMEVPRQPFILSHDNASSSKTDQESSTYKAQEDNEVDHIIAVPKPSLYFYKLPTFPADIIEKLENGIPIEARDRSVLLETLYESIVPYTYYPSAADYIYFTKLFLERYPQLLPQAGPIRGFPDNWEAWRQKLMHMFKNKRKRKDRDVAAVQKHTRNNFEGLDELQGTSGQACDGKGDRVQSNNPSEADEEVFEVIDDDQDVLIKEKDSLYHVVAADSTNLDDTSAIGVVQESISSSPFMQSLRIPETNMFITHENEHCRSTATHSSNEPCNKILKDSTTLPTYAQRSSLQPSQMHSSSITERSLPHSHQYKVYEQSTEHLQKEPLMRVVLEPCMSKANVETSRIPENSFHPSRDHASSTIIDQGSSSNKCQEDSPNDVDPIMSVLTSDPNKPSLYSYKLPTFPDDIIEKLDNGIPIEARDRSILLETLYESIVPYTYYPSAADYIYFTNLFLERYPLLLPQAGPIRDCLDNWEAWRQKLMHMFKNKRKRKDRDVAAVQQHTRKNFRYFEGLDELQGTSGQACDSKGDRVQSNTPSEADEEVFEVMDDNQDVLIKKEDSLYHVVAADSTNLDDTSAIRVVQESISSSPFMQSSRIPETNMFITHENEHHRPIATHSSNEQCNKILKDLTTFPTYAQRSSPLPSQMHSSSILERGFPHSHQYKCDEQTTRHLQREPVMKVGQEQCLSKANMEVSRGSAFPPSRDHASSTITNQGSSSNKRQEDSPNDVDPIMSVLTSDPDKPSLYSYKLPIFPADIIDKLENDIPIEARDRSILLETLYESIVPYTYYPSAADYIYFTKLFLEQYPQLLPQAGPIRDCPDNWEAWRQKLMHMFKNKRKRKDRDVAAVQQHTRKNLRYFEGLDELQGTSGQACDSKGDRVQSNTPSEADEEVFEVMDDNQDVLIKKEDSLYHVVAADSTNLDDTSAIRVVQEFITHEIEHRRPIATHSSNEPCNKILQDSTTLPTYAQRSLPLPSQLHSSSITERSLPHSHQYKVYEQSTEHLQKEPLMRVVLEPCLSKANVQTSRIPENTFHPSRLHASSTITDQGSSSSQCQEDSPNGVDPIMSVLTSDPNKPSLYSYELPKFPAYIMEKLDNGIPIEAQDRSILLEIIYESIVPYTYYPSAADYAYFTNLFLERYPQLLPQAGPIRDCLDNWEAWRQKLMHKFKNKRKRKDRDVAVVQQHTRKNFRYFEGLDELQGTSGQAIDGSGDHYQTDEEFLEVMDVAIKEEDSNHHVMAADTSNPGHT